MLVLSIAFSRPAWADAFLGYVSVSPAAVTSTDPGLDPAVPPTTAENPTVGRRPSQTPSPRHQPVPTAKGLRRNAGLRD